MGDTEVCSGECIRHEHELSQTQVSHKSLFEQDDKHGITKLYNDHKGKVSVIASTSLPGSSNGSNVNAGLASYTNCDNNLLNEKCVMQESNYPGVERSL